jgi:hypothetical protein
LNCLNKKKEKISIGNWYKCNKKYVDAEKYYSNLVDEADIDFLKLKESVNFSNSGTCFVSFKCKNKIEEVILELK